MINIIQYKVAESELTYPFTKMSEFEIELSTSLIQKDIERLENELSISKAKYNRANLKALINYLTKLLNKVKNNDNKLEMCWTISNGLPSTYPVKLINEPLYKINLCSYIELDNTEKLIDIDMIDLADIMAFEFMHRELGENHDTIENLLKDCGIVGNMKSSLLTDYFKKNGDKVYELSKTMKITDTPYNITDKKLVHDYFNSKTFKSDSYRNVVDYSCRYANTMIANKIIKNCSRCSIPYKILCITATNIVFMITTKDESFSVKEQLIDEISLRSFGRHFKIEPKLEIF